jgi:hypothetical protein
LRIEITDVWRELFTRASSAEGGGGRSLVMISIGAAYQLTRQNKRRRLLSVNVEGGVNHTTAGGPLRKPNSSA